MMKDRERDRERSGDRSRDRDRRPNNNNNNDGDSYRNRARDNDMDGYRDRDERRQSPLGSRSIPRKSPEQNRSNPTPLTTDAQQNSMNVKGNSNSIISSNNNRGDSDKYRDYDREKFSLVSNSTNPDSRRYDGIGGGPGGGETNSFLRDKSTPSLDRKSSQASSTYDRTQPLSRQNSSTTPQKADPRRGSFDDMLADLDETFKRTSASETGSVKSNTESKSTINPVRPASRNSGSSQAVYKNMTDEIESILRQSQQQPTSSSSIPSSSFYNSKQQQPQQQSSFQSSHKSYASSSSSSSSNSQQYDADPYHQKSPTSPSRLRNGEDRISPTTPSTRSTESDLYSNRRPMDVGIPRPGEGSQIGNNNMRRRPTDGTSSTVPQYHNQSSGSDMSLNRDRLPSNPAMAFDTSSKSSTPAPGVNARGDSKGKGASSSTPAPVFVEEPIDERVSFFCYFFSFFYLENKYIYIFICNNSFLFWICYPF